MTLTSPEAFRVKTSGFAVIIILLWLEHIRKKGYEHGEKRVLPFYLSQTNQPVNYASLLSQPWQGHPLVIWYPCTSPSANVTRHPRRIPSAYSLPGLMHVVRPIFATDCDSWM